MSDLDEVFGAIRAWLAETDDTPVGKEQRERMLARLHNLARRNREPMDYLEPDRVKFPSTLPIAFAVCHPECGACEFLVEGSSQVCEYCGGSMFRTETREYRLIERPT